MKRALSIGLALVLSYTMPYREARAQAGGLAVLVVTVVAAGGILTIWLMTHNAESKTRWYVLEKGKLDGQWIPVATNTLRMPPDKAFHAFDALMSDDASFYRVHEISRPDGWALSPLRVCGSATERPYIQP